MYRVLRWLIGTLCCVLTVLFLSVCLFLARPEKLLTSWTAGAALSRLGAPYALRWSSLGFNASALGPRRHRYVLQAANVCADDPKGAFSACFSEFELAAIVRWSRHGPKLERVERLVAVSAGARVDQTRLPKGGGGNMPALLTTTPVEALRVELTRFAFNSSSAAASGNLRVALTPGVRRPLSVATNVLIRSSSGLSRLKAEITADTDILNGGAATYVDIAGKADLGTRGRARAAFRVRREKLRYVGTGSAEIWPSTGPLKGIRLSECKATAPLAAGAVRPAGGAGACRYELSLTEGAAQALEGIKVAKGTVSLSGGITGQTFEATVKADIEPIQAWYELTGDLAVHAEGRLDRAPAGMKVSHELRATARVPRFEELVAVLRDTKYAVPAPVHVLKGPLMLALESHGDPRADRQAVHYVFSSELAGARQRLAMRATGDLSVVNARTPARAFEHNGELILQDVALELPRLDIGHTPKPFFDKRIKSDDEPAPAPAAGARPAPTVLSLPPIRSRLVVKTDKPVILFSNLAKTPLPVGLDLLLTYPPSAAAGKISVRAFDVELFRRNATMDHLNVVLTSGSANGAMEGLVRYKTPTVTINILILGTTEKPRIELTSVPPMKREDIIALLIFGKNPDELDPEQTASVGNTETALESRAFGLASLYLFGATPIEHVGYDSATKTASVKMRLPGGANLTLGSDFDHGRQLSVRKPLAPHWAIQSEVTDQAQQSRAATTFLEWFNRY